MAHIDLETTIAAPASAVFNVLNAPERRPEWMTNLHEVRTTSQSGNNESWEYTYTMYGRPFTGKVRVEERETNRYMKLEVTGGITGVQEWRLTPMPDGTTVLRFTFDYTVPALLGGGIADKLFIEQQNIRQFRTSLENLASLVEHEHGVLEKEHTG
jgi:uncharacterized membrane protein